MRRDHVSHNAQLMSIDHINLSMPEKAEEVSDTFYRDLLGLSIKPKPDEMTTGRWYSGTGFEVHLGSDPDFAPASRAHPAFRVAELDSLVSALEDQGIEIRKDVSGDKLTRAFVFDPFGNRIELISA